MCKCKVWNVITNNGSALFYEHVFNKLTLVILTYKIYNSQRLDLHGKVMAKVMAYTDYYERALTNGVLNIQRCNEPGIMIYMFPQEARSSKVVLFN